MRFPAINFSWFCLSLGLMLLVGCSKNNDETDVQEDPSVKNPQIAVIADAIHADSLKKTVLWLQGMNSRFFLHDNRKQIATDIKNRFVRLGYINARIDSFFLTVTWAGKAYSTWQYNVAARLEGGANAGKVYLAGAHYDSYSTDPYVNAPGADDNASGVSGIIEIARVFKKNGFVPKNSIEFVAFAAEEIGLKGSADYAIKSAATKVDIVSMLNLDMISYSPGTNPDTWILNVMDYDNSSDLRSRIVSCGKLYSKLTFVNNNTNSKRGDSYSFYQKGFKANFLISEFYADPFYHTVNDIFDNYNYPFCREVVAVSCAFLVQENL